MIISLFALKLKAIPMILTPNFLINCYNMDNFWN